MRFTAFPPPPPHPITLIFAPFAETCTTRLARCRCVGFLAASRNRRRSDTAVAPPRVNPLVRIVPAALIGTVRSALCRRARHHAQRNQMKSRLQQTPLIDGLKLKKVTPARFWIEAEKEILAESKSISYAQTVTERKHLGRRDPTIQPQRSVCAFETIMQNGTPTTTDVDSGRLRVKKTNRPLPRCADEDLGFGTVRARYSQAVGKEGGARPPIAAFENRVDYGDGRAIVEVFA